MPFVASADKSICQNIFLIQLVIFVAFQGLDLATTLYGLRHGAIEVNTYVVELGRYISTPLAVFLNKVIFSLVFIWLYCALVKNKKTSIPACIIGYGLLNIFYSLVFINNIAIIYFLK